MKGDFTRDTFDPFQHFTRVLMQQGRVQLDADWNEQAAIAQHTLRTLAADIIGPHGGPEDECGFALITDAGEVDQMKDKYGRPLDDERQATLKELLANKEDFVIGAGRYYVNGVLCQNDEPVAYSEHMGGGSGQQPLRKKLPDGKYLFYLDVRERHVTFLESGGIREVALGGPDTATRTQLVWQVKVWDKLDPKETKGFPRISNASLRARAARTDDPVDACVVSSESRYRGAENQLYRVEIHRGGEAAGDGANEVATFKWSRDNGSVVLPIMGVTPDTAAKITTVNLASLGRDSSLGVAEGDWVELVDDDSVLQNLAGQLLEVRSVSRDDNAVVLEGVHDTDAGKNPSRHPLLRRWDHDGSGGDNGALPVREPTAEEGWIELEDGVQIQFAEWAKGTKNTYRSGDYWLIPARAATGDVEWPRKKDKSADGWEWIALPPRGVLHNYAPLATASWTSGTGLTVLKDLRRKFNKLSSDSDV